MTNQRVHHLNCGTMTPLAAAPMVAHVLLVERDEGLLLVDTGFGSADLARPKRLGQPFRAVVRPLLDPAETAAARITALGLDPVDVTDVVLTHLDLDHVGGIGDFPQARVHVHATELEAALHPSLKEKARYVAEQWAHDPTWVRHREGGDTWHGLDSVTAVGDDVVIVPLHGHSRGHSGVAVRRLDGHWLLHAGDSYFHTGEKLTPPSCPRPLRVFQTVLAHADKARRANAERVRELHATHGGPGGTVTVFSAHDASELAALQA
ncbi:MBL fold metallo-hydrolase [Nocardioides psychrotolerans]|uniref:Metallo-beta-lactamase superfamily protein n=1 Tax=Nocardioides psychrotolerans TaxID=1005945 RepID=A0A1I3GGI8_9ACTN|nr:MBL fold metallo-hydrolase [Nocardioides psychrotolerans]GEP39899.1 MBL fold metallo-hydrolase [Nocardioides psychrotolerans]SFI22618.1 Metallo-beta-lactamase superfamily protein [Nocardioides psychrotolerans]